MKFSIKDYFSKCMVLYLPPIVHNPPIIPMITASHGRMTFAGAVIATRPPRTPPTNSGMFSKYFLFKLNKTFKSIADNPPPTAPFIVTTATRVAVLHVPVLRICK